MFADLQALGTLRGIVNASQEAARDGDAERLSLARSLFEKYADAARHVGVSAAEVQTMREQLA